MVLITYVLHTLHCKQCGSTVIWAAWYIARPSVKFRPKGVVFSFPLTLILTLILTLTLGYSQSGVANAQLHAHTVSLWVPSQIEVHNETDTAAVTEAQQEVSTSALPMARLPTLVRALMVSAEKAFCLAAAPMRAEGCSCCTASSRWLPVDNPPASDAERANSSF